MDKGLFCSNHRTGNKRIQVLDDRINGVTAGRVMPDLEQVTIGSGRQFTLTVLFLDICGFSARPNWTADERKLVLAIMNIFMAEMLNIVRDFGGTYEKNTGDGLMAHFGEGCSTDQDRVKPAVEAATVMHYANDQLFMPWFQERGVQAELPQLIAPSEPLPGHSGPPLEGHTSTTAVTPPHAAPLSGPALDESAKHQFLWRTHEYLGEYARFADTKAAFAGTIAPALIGALQRESAYRLNAGTRYMDYRGLANHCGRRFSNRFDCAATTLAWYMPKFTSNVFLPAEQYSDAVDTLHVLCGMLLFEFARNSEELRDRILHNFIARADVTMRGIIGLWELKDYQDCWALHRAMLDRLFHLHALHERNEFELFEAWSFKKQYEAAMRLKSDADTKDILKSVLYEPTPEQHVRYRAMQKNPPEWHRPKAEDTAKAMGLSFLYKYGYDFGSRHVHPMADDGQEDFYNITGLEPRPTAPDWRAVLSNSVLAASLIVREALNASSMAWHKLVFDALNGITEFLVTGSPVEFLPMIELSELYRHQQTISRRSSEVTP